MHLPHEFHLHGDFFDDGLLGGATPGVLMGATYTDAMGSLHVVSFSFVIVYSSKVRIQLRVTGSQILSSRFANKDSIGILTGPGDSALTIVVSNGSGMTPVVVSNVQV